MKRDEYSLKASIAIIALFIGGGFYLFSHPSDSKTIFESQTEKLSLTASSIPATPDVAKVIAETEAPPSGYVEYRNEKYGFYYYHSPEAKITEYNEGGGAMTITQENLSKMRGMQIFIVPYDGKIITDERFLRDAPSGVRYNIESTNIGYIDVPAVTFNSYDQFLGDTREVWFIHNGYLYEVTTFKGFGDWFSGIMKTWRFI